jgi:cytochrome b-245 alpha polypeptide
MGRIEWAIWANVQAVYGAPSTLLGGIIGTFDFKNEWAAYYAIIISVFIWLLEYPRGKRRRGNTPARP